MAIIKGKSGQLDIDIFGHQLINNDSPSPLSTPQSTYTVPQITHPPEIIPHHPDHHPNPPIYPLDRSLTVYGNLVSVAIVASLESENHAIAHSVFHFLYFLESIFPPDFYCKDRIFTISWQKNCLKQLWESIMKKKNKAQRPRMRPLAIECQREKWA